MPHPSLRLTPHGHLVLEEAPDAPELDDRIASRLADRVRARQRHGLLQLGAGEVGHPLPPLFLWWRAFATQYVARTVPPANHPGRRAARDPAARRGANSPSLVLTAPMMAGAEYLTPDVLRALWQRDRRRPGRRR